MSAKTRLAPIGQQRPYFSGQAKDGLQSVMAEEQQKAVVKEKEWRDIQKTKFPTYSPNAAEAKSEIGRDIDVRTLIEDIRGLEQGQTSVKKLIQRDLVTLNFCLPREAHNPQTADDFVYTAEYRATSDARLCEHNIRLDGFARYNNDRAKYKSTMRS
jgi:hypothetical protein